MKDVLVTRENFKHVQGKGKQNLRFMILLFFLFLIAYSILCYFMMSALFHGKVEDIEKRVLIRTGMEVVICFVIIVQLWKYSKLGKLFFTIYAFASFYSCKELPALFNISLPDFQDQLLRMIFIMLMIGKNILGFSCMLRLYTDKRIRCIWSLYDLYERDLMELDGKEESDKEVFNTQRLDAELEKHPVRYQESKLEIKAKSYLRIYTYLLLFYVYGSMCVIYMFMFVMRYYNPKDIDGMEFVQRILLLSCLFSALIWSLPAVSMFLYKRWASFTIWAMGILEITRMLWSFPHIYRVFQTQHYLLPSIITFIIIESLRYMILFRMNRKIYRNPFIKAFWNKKYQNIIHKRESIDDEEHQAL